MTQPQIVERLSRLPSGGIITNTGRFDSGYLGSVLNTFRLKTLQVVVNGDRYTAKNKRINPQYLQKHWPVYESVLQEPSVPYVQFRCPEIASIDSTMDGLQYCGSISGSCNFRRILNRGQLSTFNQNKFTNIDNGTGLSCLYDGSQQIIEIYGGGKMLRELLLECVFIDPTQIPTYNIEKDQYPISDSDLTILERLVLSEQTLLESRTPQPNEYSEIIK